MHFLNQLLFLIVIELHVPFGQSCLPCSVLDEDEADLYDENSRERKHRIEKKNDYNKCKSPEIRVFSVVVI